MLETVCIDTGATTDAEVIAHKSKTSEYFSQSKTGSKINAAFNQNVILQLSNIEYLQSLLMWELVNKVLGMSVPYYVQRLPQQLSSFNWIVDSKNKGYEKIFRRVVASFVQSINYANPKVTLAGKDYSAFERYLVPSEKIVEPLKSKVDGASLIYSIDNILKNLSFERSHESNGVQMVDILGSCIGRAMRGNLQRD